MILSVESHSDDDMLDLGKSTSDVISVYDAVRSKSCGKIGLVTEAADDFDWYDTSFCFNDQVEVLWENDSEKGYVSRNDITLVSRGLLVPGSLVASYLDPSGQTGVATDVSISVDLLTPNGDVISGVDSRDLIHVKEFSLRRMVVFGSWVGLIDDIIDNVTVLFDNGSVSEFKKASEMSLEPIEKMTKIDGSFPNHPGYYPGQHVKARFLSVCYKNPRLLVGIWKPKILEGKVTKVSVESVSVDWFCYAGRGGDDSYTKPDEKQSPQNLKKLPFFDYAIWILFGRCLLKDIEGVLKIVNVKKTVNVAWQDGTIDKGLNSTTLIVKHETTSPFFPEQFVRVKNTQDNNDDCKTRLSGIIRSVDSKEQTALVRWEHVSNESGDSQESDEEEEEVSLYDIEIHPERKYFFGDLVGESPPSSVPVNSAEVSSSNGDFIDLPHIGCVTGLENGNITVLWTNGTVSKVFPEDIFGVANVDSVDDDYEYSIESEESETFHEKLFFALLEAFDFIGSLKMLYFWAINQLNMFSLKPTCKRNELQCQKILFESSSKGFDIIEDPSDHYFVGTYEQGVNVTRKWLKKVEEDWRILQNDLPDGIFVRVYEDRMDLFRAMIVGPYGTPYQDGLFFFDFQLPLEYPYVPPVVHYYSGGWRINPNLYEDGKICLSLLNTWHGKGTEVWDSSSSSVLQVLVSIQGLILNTKPYFNEAGYDKLTGSTKGEKDSLSYNENTYLLNCKRMMHIMHHPLKGFEELVREHFVGRGYYILKACDAYLKGYLIGSLSKDASPSENSIRNANSIGFKRTLGSNVVPKLYAALKEVGADCHEFKYLAET